MLNYAGDAGDGFIQDAAAAYPLIRSGGQRIIMRPSSLGGGRILRRTLSVCLSVRLSVCVSVRPVIVAIGNVFSAPLASRRAT